MRKSMCFTFLLINGGYILRMTSMFWVSRSPYVNVYTFNINNYTITQFYFEKIKTVHVALISVPLANVLFCYGNESENKYFLSLKVRTRVHVNYPPFFKKTSINRIQLISHYKIALFEKLQIKYSARNSTFLELWTSFNVSARPIQIPPKKHLNLKPIEKKGKYLKMASKNQRDKKCCGYGRTKDEHKQRAQTTSQINKVWTLPRDVYIYIHLRLVHIGREETECTRITHQVWRLRVYRGDPRSFATLRCGPSATLFFFCFP